MEGESYVVTSTAIEQLNRMVRQTLSLSQKYGQDEHDDIEWRWARWDWSIGVAFYGIAQAYEVSPHAGWFEEMQRWIDAKIDGGMKNVCVNSTMPLHAVLSLRERLLDDPKYERICERYDRYLMQEQKRTPSGAIPHFMSAGGAAAEIWADTLFVSVIYLARRGAALGEKSYVREAVKQLVLHMAKLRDESSKLYFHGWDDVASKPLGFLWGRGNAWVTSAAVDILQYEPEDTQEKRLAVGMLNEQLDALACLQDESGMWRTVLDRPDSYLETSVTAGVAYGILKGIRLGLVDEKFKPAAERAVAAVLANVDAEGNVLGGSSGTAVQADLEGYRTIPLQVTAFTQGLGLLAVAEWIRSERTKASQ